MITAPAKPGPGRWSEGWNPEDPLYWEHSDKHDPEAESVSLSDAARGRYARVTLRDQQITGAILFGFPEAVASVSQLHDRGSSAPSNRLGLLLGTAARVSARPVELPGDAVVCRCNSVTKQAVTRAWHAGARSLLELAKATRATTGCGSCTDEIRRLCTSLTHSPTSAGKESAA